MKKVVFIIALTSSVVGSLKAQTVHGLWNNVDEDTGKVNSVIKIFKGSDGLTYGNIVEVFGKDSDKDAVCSECDEDDYRKGKKILGMQILTGLEKDGDEYNNGEILDPQKGKIYSCYMKLVGDDKLKVKGHLKGFSFIGRSVYWKRKK